MQKLSCEFFRFVLKTIKVIKVCIHVCCGQYILKKIDELWTGGPLKSHVFLC